MVNGVRIRYVDTGNAGASPLVLIHGFPLSHEMWTPQIDVLGDRYRVIAYDLRGHGKSDVGDGQYMLEFFVDDLIGLLDHLEIGKATLCGFSMGGYIALRAIERNPERFEALILCDTQARADTNEAKLKRAASIKLIKNEGVKPFAEGFVKSAFAPQSFVTKVNTIEIIKNMIQSNSSVGICGTLLALAGRTDTTAALSKIKVQTLIIVGEHDALTPPLLSREMHHEIPNSQLRIIENAGHLGNLEDPDEFNAQLLDFLRRAS